MAGFERSKARKVETAMDRWNSEWDRPGQRDTGYWLLGVALKKAGCDAGEIADRLDHCRPVFDVEGEGQASWFYQAYGQETRRLRFPRSVQDKMMRFVKQRFSRSGAQGALLESTKGNYTTERDPRPAS